MANLKTSDEFIEFLKKRKIYRQFKNNFVKSVSEGRDLDKFLKSKISFGLMSEAFQGSFGQIQKKDFNSGTNMIQNGKTFTTGEGGQNG